MNKTVQVLDLTSNSIGDEGTTALAEGLKVRFSSFFANFPRFFGYRSPLSNSLFLVVLSVQVNKSVKDLILMGNGIGDEGTIALAEALKVSFVFFRECSAFSWLPPPR